MFLEYSIGDRVQLFESDAIAKRIFFVTSSVEEVVTEDAIFIPSAILTV